VRRIAALLLLAGCAAAAPMPPAQGLMVAPYGLQPVGSALRIDFGRAEEGVIDPVSRLVGAQPVTRGAYPSCGARITRAVWGNGLVLYFRDGDFEGWAAPGEFPAAAGLPAPTGVVRTAGLTCA
jgi:hypothetical protein